MRLDTNQRNALTRRQFLGGMLAAAAASSPLALASFAQNAPDAKPAPAEFKRKIKLGVVGNGGRGRWIAGLFRKHGGYEIRAVADYFPDVADRCGDELGVDRSRRFSTLSGYKRLLECGVEAVALEVPPYFFPEQAGAAVEAGLHVYLAKPVAVDVPGCLRIEAAAKKARQNQRCFLVDYQMPTDPANQEVCQRIRGEGFGRISQVNTLGFCGGQPDPAKTATLESRLQHLIWVNDIALSCDYIGNYDIHAIDAAIWVLGRRPVAAMGSSSICRPDPHGDSRDVCSVVFEYADGLVHNHLGQALPNQVETQLACRVYGQQGQAQIDYFGRATFRSQDDAYSAAVENLYEAGAVRNIAAFHRNIITGQCENKMVERAVDSALACILGREAGLRQGRLSMEQLLHENKALEVNLSGLKS